MTEQFSIIGFIYIAASEQFYLLQSKSYPFLYI